MTERLYYNDSHLTEFDAQIIESTKVGERYVTILDRSAFYPTSGGQLHDTGLINDVQIVEVDFDDNDIVRHYSEQPIGQPGDSVHGQVDSERRRRFMQQHTAQHIISSVFHRQYERYTRSVHLGEEYGAVELEGDPIPDNILAAVETKANQLIAENLPIEIRFVTKEEALQLPLRRVPDRDGTFRIIRIGELDYSACGGTHCKSSIEVRLIKFTGIEKLRKRWLVKFLAGDLAVADYVDRFEVAAKLADNFTCHFSDLPEKVLRLESDLKDATRKLHAMQKDQLPQIAEKLKGRAETIAGTPLVVASVDDLDLKLVGSLATIVAEQLFGISVIMSGEKLFIAAVPECKHKAGALARDFCKETSLRGGGGDTLAQIGGVNAEAFDQYKEVIIGLLANEQ